MSNEQVKKWHKNNSEKISKYKKSYNEKNRTYCIPDSQLFNGCTKDQIKRLNQYEMKSDKYLGI